MNNNLLLLTALLLPSIALAQDSWTPEQREVLHAIGELSASTAPGGAGAGAYGALLADEYSRWTVGSSVINEKESWVAGVREWFDDGWRVSDRRSENLEISVQEGIAFTRRIVTETYLGPEGEQSVSTAALAEVWVRRETGWVLLRVDIHPMNQ